MVIEPTIPQARFLQSTAKAPLMVGGYGSAKTFALILRSIVGAIRNPKFNRAFYEPTYDLIRMIAWPRFEEMLISLGIDYALRKSPLNEIQIQGCGKIIFRSMDNYSRIIGYEVADSDVDEIDTLKPDVAADVWRRIVARNRQKKPNGENTIGVATTPEGFGFAYKTWAVDPPDGYEIIRAPTSSNPHLPDDYIEQIRKIYPSHLLPAYLEGHFVNLTAGTVYREFSRYTHASDARIVSGEELHIGMDFNVGNMSAVVHVIRDSKPHAVEEITKALDTPDICGIIARLYAGHRIHIYPDASSASRKSNNAGQTDLHVLRRAGFAVHSTPSNPLVRDRINAMNAAFCNGYRVNLAGCPEYARCLEQQAYDKNGEPDKSHGHDHLNDAAGYFVIAQYPIIRPAMTLKMGFAQ